MTRWMTLLALCVATSAHAMSLAEAEQIMNQTRYVQCMEGVCRDADTMEFISREDRKNGYYAFAPAEITQERLREASELIVKHRDELATPKWSSIPEH